MEMNKELLAKAKTAKSAEELLALAKENGFELTEEETQKYFAKLNPKSGELTDEELDNVAGGGCGDEAVGVGDCCEHWVCRYSGVTLSNVKSRYAVNMPGSFVGHPRCECGCGPYHHVVCADCKYSYMNDRKTFLYCGR